MGFIIDTPEELEVGLEARRESFYISAADDGRKVFTYATRDLDDPENTTAATIELTLDQVDPLIEGLQRLKAYLAQRG